MNSPSPDDLLPLLLSWAGLPDMPARVAELCPCVNMGLLRQLKEKVDEKKTSDASYAYQIAEVGMAVANCLPHEAEAKPFAHWMMGNARYHQSEYGLALAHYQQAQRWYKRCPDKGLIVAILLVNRIAVHQDRAEFKRAIRLGRFARPLCATDTSEIGRKCLAMLEMNVGSAYHQLGGLQEALEGSQRAHQLFLQLGEEIAAARITINIANILKDMDRYQEAASLLNEAHQTLSRLGQWQEVARAELNLGVLAFFQGQHEEALRWLEQAQRGFRHVDNAIDCAVVEMYRALLYQRLNLWQEAAALAQSALDVFRAKKLFRHRAAMLVCQGLIYHRYGQYHEADALLKQALRLLTSQGSRERVMLLRLERAELAIERQALGLARRLLREAQRALKAHLWPAQVARIHLLWARWELARKRPRWREIQGQCRRALELANRFHLPEIVIGALHIQGQAAEQQGHPHRALRFYRAAIRLVETRRERFMLDEFRMGFMEDKLPLYEAAIRLSHWAADPAPLLLLLTLRQRLGIPAALLATLAPALLSQEAREIGEHLQTLYRGWQWLANKREALADSDSEKITKEQREQLEAKLRSVEAAIADATRRFLACTRSDRGTEIAPSLTSLHHDATPFQAVLQARLGPTDALLHLYEVEGTLWALVVQAHTVHRIALETTAWLTRRHNAWLGLVRRFVGGEEPHREASGVLAHLYQRLFAPLEPYLTASQRLFLVLPPAWHTLPLAALFDGSHFIAERFRLVYLSSAEARLSEALPAPTMAPATAPAALVVGYSSDGRLPATKQEAEAVAARLTPAYSVTLLREGEAVLDAFYEASRHSRLIHLATHAEFKSENPLLSWIELAGDRLAVGRLYEMALPQRPLVVLSACETGRGAARGGGLLGVGRGLQAAGASGLVLSLWQVEDVATAHLMGDFYGALDLTHPLTEQAAAALQAAQRQAIARGISPFRWAAFLFMGG